jgi:hypothetical protein
MVDGMVDGEEELVCHFCPEDENRWPASAFRLSGKAYTGDRRMCGACYEQKYPKRRVGCSSCGRAIYTRGNAPHPLCRACRSGLPAARVCLRCGAPADGRVICLSSGLCKSCGSRMSEVQRSRREQGLAPLALDVADCIVCGNMVAYPPMAQPVHTRCKNCPAPVVHVQLSLTVEHHETPGGDHGDPQEDPREERHPPQLRVG